MKHRPTFAPLVCLIISAVAAQAGDVTGQWKSEFESPVGHLKYVYDLKADGAKVTGKAHREWPEGKTDTELKDGKIDGDSISFTEPLHVQDQDLTIEYKGKINGDEIKFTRKVGDFGSTDIVAHRETATAAPSLNGKWRAEFDTQIGKQKYLFTLHADGAAVTGKANAEIGDQKMETALTDGKINGADVSFTEQMDFAGQPVHITYKGVLAGDQLKLTRKVGDIATEELTANREK
ncbi:MAG TPA: hypothetical protein VHB20_13310 [Verrucomicrobiae bacterium]|jgi:hypothetical protein|nr:hypothetical protein [Verrucomicrobiae bacterium]